MIAKILMIGGLLVSVVSCFMVVWSIHSSFEGMKNAETAGIHLVAKNITTAMYSSIAIGVGFLIFIAGLIKFILDKRKSVN